MIMITAPDLAMLSGSHRLFWWCDIVIEDHHFWRWSTDLTTPPKRAILTIDDIVIFSD
jgi:hypothetical protein